MRSALSIDAAQVAQARAGIITAHPQVKMSAMMPEYQPMFSAWVCLRRSALSPVLEMNVSIAAILPSFAS